MTQPLPHPFAKHAKRVDAKYDSRFWTANKYTIIVFGEGARRAGEIERKI